LDRQTIAQNAEGLQPIEVDLAPRLIATTFTHYRIIEKIGEGDTACGRRGVLVV
jgi:hypothetical protein